jgi:hypothetical protein
MTRIATLTTGASFVLLGSLILGWNALTTAFGLPAPALWRLWPLLPAGLALILLLPPFLARREPALGTLFIAGLPMLAIGCIGLLSNVVGPGFAWSGFWPQILVAFGLGLGLAARWLRSAWLIVPALFFGLLGTALQFTALTGWWSAWAVLWAVVPFSLGLALASIGLLRRSTGLRVAGLLVCAFALILALGVGAIVTGQWLLINFAAALALIAAGGALASWGLLRARPAAMSANQSHPTAL